MGRSLGIVPGSGKKPKMGCGPGSRKQKYGLEQNTAQHVDLGVNSHKAALISWGRA